MVVVIRPNGEVTAIAHADTDAYRLRALGRITTARRGGHVLPANAVLRVAFAIIRRLPGDPLATWTRKWPGKWIVVLHTGQKLGPYFSRADAIRAEEEEIARMLLRSGGQK